MLDASNLGSTCVLLWWAAEHEKQLIRESLREKNNGDVSLHDLTLSLRQLGLTVPQKPWFDYEARWMSSLSDNPEENDDCDYQDEAPSSQSREEEEKEVRLNRKNFQWPPPKGRYPYKQDDLVTTKLSHEPLSLCKLCSSLKHWDREDPHWPEYVAKMKQRQVNCNVMHTMSKEEEPDPYKVYEAEYTGLVQQIHYEEGFWGGIPWRVFEKESIPWDWKYDPGDNQSSVQSESRPAVTIEEVDEVEESNVNPLPNQHCFLMEEARFNREPYEDSEDSLQRSHEVHFRGRFEDDVRGEEQELPPAPEALKPFWLKKKRNFKPGESAKGVLVLAAKG